MSSFKSQTLVDKLSRLNSSQQSIETISAWCTFYRKACRLFALLVVDAWHAPPQHPVSAVTAITFHWFMCLLCAAFAC